MPYAESRLCPMGALEFYLHIRLLVGKEHEEFDFDDNTTWFNEKLICSIPKASKRKQKRIPLEQEAIDEMEEVLGTLTIFKLLFINGNCHGGFIF